MSNQMKYAVVAAAEAGMSEPVLFRGDILASAQKALDMGYAAIEFHARRSSELDGDALQAFCEKTGFAVSALATGLAKRVDGLNFIDDDAQVRDAAVERVKGFIDLAARLGSGVILGSLRGMIPDKENREIQDRRFLECMKQLLERAEQKGVDLLLEVINRYENNYLNTVAETLAYIQPLNSDRVKVHVDTFHMNIEETDMAAAVESCGDKLGYIHVADNTRLAVGTGTINFKAVLDAARRIGYTGYVSVECLPVPDGEAAARASLKALQGICS